MKMLLPATTAIALYTLLAAGAARAHEDHPAAETAFGRAGVAQDSTRTVDVSMGDTMRFSPDSLVFAEGETVRIRLHNTGSVAHEFILGTAGEISEHAELMKRFPNMVHDDPSARRLAAGQSADIVWQFTRPGHFVFACLIPGHAEAGMHGTIDVTAAPPAASPAASTAPVAPAPATDDAATALTHGEVLKLDAAQGKLTIRHGPIRNLGMPGMTMMFRVADKALLNGIAVGDQVDFFVEDRGAAFVITRMTRTP